MDVVLQSRTPEHGLGRHYTETAAGHGRIVSTFETRAKRGHYHVNETFEAFSDYKQTKARACARRNAPSNVLYVGSSITGLKKRISEHLGDGSASTYALQLKHWFKGTHQVTVKVYDVPAAVLQIVEDALAHKLRPAFGKMGGNNR